MKKIIIGLMCLVMSSLSFARWEGTYLKDRFGNADKNYYGAIGYEKVTNEPVICVYSTGFMKILTHRMVGRLPDSNSDVTDVVFLFNDGTKINCIGSFRLNEAYLLEKFYPEKYKYILDNIKKSKDMKISIRNLYNGYNVLEIDNTYSTKYINRMLEIQQ